MKLQIRTTFVAPQQFWWETQGSLGCSLQRQSARRSHDATSRALWEQNEADTNLQNHFQSIQRISDTTTLPQMLVELERGLDRAANVDLLISQLRYASNYPEMIGWEEFVVITSK